MPVEWEKVSHPCRGEIFSAVRVRLPHYVFGFALFTLHPRTKGVANNKNRLAELAQDPIHQKIDRNMCIMSLTRKSICSNAKQTIPAASISISLFFNQSSHSLYAKLSCYFVPLLSLMIMFANLPWQNSFSWFFATASIINRNLTNWNSKTRLLGLLIKSSTAVISEIKLVQL